MGWHWTLQDATGNPVDADAPEFPTRADAES